ncbi:hypothetical protein [Sporisorium scitamineum]|uniref:Uncharacterized protein n=1 Tax=Sporisorium scitamineum TaxID=49012 RepID=A0A0F7RZQ7_9BASI|nr:hypothetical protein [Sporisorium scitamineum]
MDKMDALKLEAISTNSYVHLTNGKHIKTDGMVTLLIDA